jgi:hypothetical protein
VNEQTRAAIDHTLDVLKECASDLRRRGYDAGLFVEDRGEEEFTVEIRVNVPAKGTPIESVPRRMIA